MKKILKHLVVAGILSSVLPAQAAIQAYNFSGEMDSGYYNGQSFTGSFSFDDAGLTSVGTEYLDVTALSMQFSGATFTEFDNLGVFPAVAFDSGTFLGLEWSANSSAPDIGFSFIPGFFDVTEAYVAYDTGLGLSGAGSVVFAPVPEADTYAMLLVGVGALAGIARRRKSA